MFAGSAPASMIEDTKAAKVGSDQPFCMVCDRVLAPHELAAHRALQQEQLAHVKDRLEPLQDDAECGEKVVAALRELLPKAHFATIYAKPQAKPLVDSFVTEVSQDTWILFPWDTEAQFIPPLIKGR